MSPGATAAAPARAARAAAPARPLTVPDRPRRVSGPVRRRVEDRPVRRRAKDQAGIALGVLAAVDRLSRHRALGGRTWIGLVAFALIGIVTLQLGLLKLNAGIGRALEHEAVLQRENAALSIENSELATSDRVTSWAVRLGMEPVPAGPCASCRRVRESMWPGAPPRSAPRRTPSLAAKHRPAARRPRGWRNSPRRHRPQPRHPANPPQRHPARRPARRNRPRRGRPPRHRRANRLEAPPKNRRENQGRPRRQKRPRLPPAPKRAAAPPKGARPAGPRQALRVKRWTSSNAG